MNLSASIGISIPLNFRSRLVCGSVSLSESMTNRSRVLVPTVTLSIEARNPRWKAQDSPKRGVFTLIGIERLASIGVYSTENLQDGS